MNTMMDCLQDLKVLQISITLLLGIVYYDNDIIQQFQHVITSMFTEMFLMLLCKYLLTGPLLNMDTFYTFHAISTYMYFKNEVLISQQLLSNKMYHIYTLNNSWY